MPERVLSTAPLAAGLALHALHRPREHLEARQRDLTSSKVSHAKNRYAVDVGVAMLVLENDRQRRLTRGETLDEALLEVAHDAAAQGALSILPYFDEITKQAGIET